MRILILTFKFCFLVGSIEFVTHKLNVSVKKIFEVIDGEVDSVVGYATLWIVVCSDSLTSVARSDLAFSVACVL